MKVTVIGSHLCPDTLYALNRLSEVKAEIEFKNLSASLPDLKAYLALRDSDPHYEAGSAGSPCGTAPPWSCILPWPPLWRRLLCSNHRHPSLGPLPGEQCMRRRGIS